MSDYKTINIDAELHQKLKLKAVQKGVTINELIRTLIRIGWKFEFIEPIDRVISPLPGRAESRMSTDTPHDFLDTAVKTPIGTQYTLKPKTNLCEHGYPKGYCKDWRCPHGPRKEA